MLDYWHYSFAYIKNILANIVYILYHIRTNVLNAEGKNYMITLRNFNKNEMSKEVTVWGNY